MTWTPHATVAAIVQQDGKFLFVEEISDGKRVINQPAGHVEESESIIEALLRETLEETGWQVEPMSLIGIYTYQAPGNGVTYYRFCYACKPIRQLPDATIDPDIEQIHWLTPEELGNQNVPQRSPLVTRCLEDYLAGRQFPLNLIYEHPGSST